MSALALLSGIASGAGESYQDISTQERQIKAQKDLALGQALFQHLASPAAEGYDWNTYSDLSRQAMKSMGAKDKDIDPILGHMQGIWTQHQAEKQNQAESQAVAASAPYLVPGQTTPGENGPTNVGTGIAPGSPIPNVPEAPFTLGDMKRQQEGATQTQTGQIQALTAGATTGATAAASNEAVNKQVKDHVDAINQTRQSMGLPPMTDQQSSLLMGLYGTGPMATFALAGRNVPGESDSSNYIGQKYADTGETITNPGEPVHVVRTLNGMQLYHGNNEAAGSPTIVRLTNPDGSPSNEWGQAIRNKYGRVLRVLTSKDVGADIVPPAAYLQRNSTIPEIRTNPDTGELEIIQTNRTSGPVLPGGPATQTATPPVPGAPKALTTQAPTGGKQAAISPVSNGALAVSPTAGSSKNFTNVPGLKVIKPPNPADPLDRIAFLAAKDWPTAQQELKTLPKPQQMKFADRMAELGLDPNNVTTSMRDRAKVADQVLQHIEEVKGIIDEADKSGELNFVMSHWNEFLNNKQIGQDTTPDKVFSRLATNYDFLSTAAAMAHGGARGGSSQPIIEHWQRALEARDADTLRAKLGEAEKWMQGYADFVKQGNVSGDINNFNQGKATPGRGGATPPPAPAALGGAPSLDSFWKK